MVELDSNVDTGRQWIFGLIFMFILGIMAIIIIPILADQVAPAMIAASTLTGADLVLYESQVDFIMFAVKTTPFILFFVVLIFLVLSVVRKEKNERQFVV